MTATNLINQVMATLNLSNPAVPPRPNVVVLGSGVLGLSIALELKSKGYHPIVVAKDLAEDVHSTGFASPWAGCNWYSFAAKDDLVHQSYDRETFIRLAKLSQEHPDLCEMIPFYDVWDEGEVEDPWFKDFVPGYKRTEYGQGKAGFNHALEFQSYIIHAPKYIAHLTQSLKDQQVLFIKHRLSSLDEAYRLPLPAHLADELGTDLLEVDLVINATGLGAKGLLGVMDEEVYPIRGQTVLVKSDFAAVDGKRCYMGTRNMAKDADGKAHEPCYIIPRPGPENHFILGGTYLADEWSPIPNLATSERMLKDCFKLNPDLAGPEREGRSWKDIEIVSHNVGLRPARRGGSRVELEERTLKVASEHDPLIPGIKEGGKEGGKKVAVVHAYGIGPAGYQASWGIAVKASGLADDWVSKRE